MQQEAMLILARAAEAKDEYTGDHVAQVGDLSKELAVAIGMARADVEGLGYAAMLHDVGKLHVPDSILLKPGRLSPSEWEVIRRHTTLGAQILGDSMAFALARTVARSHHENWDGSGYPDGLAALEIPLAARVVRLVDVFDALRSQRPYKPAWSFERCVEELLAGAGEKFDPELVPVFVGLLERLHSKAPLVLPVRRASETAA
jgi:putative two-component system response regulator